MRNTLSIACRNNYILFSTGRPPPLESYRGHLWARQEGLCGRRGRGGGGDSSPFALLSVLSLGITWDYCPDFVVTEYRFILPCLEPLENLLNSSLGTAESSAGSGPGRGEGSFRVA